VSTKKGSMSYKVKFHDEGKIHIREIPTYYSDIHKLNNLCIDEEEDLHDEDSMFNLTYDWLVNRLLDLYIEEFGGEWENLNIEFLNNHEEDSEEEILTVNVVHL
jgi:hypothetical protein